MERAEAEAVYEQGRETVVAVLLELSAQNALLRREVAELSEANRRLEIRVADLEERLKRNSRNSSLPPSQDPPAAPERRRAAPSGRGRGAQPGHPGRGRHLAPIASLDELIEHWPSRCRCGHVFRAAERAARGEPARHQLAELPPTAVLLSEHRLQRLRCPDCGATTRAELPAGVPPGAFGPRLQAAVASLAVRNRVSRRDTTELLRELFGAELSTGSIDAILQHAALALDEPYEDLLGHIRSASVVNVDETGWRLRGGKRTLQGGAHLPRRGLPQRRGSPPPRGPGAARRGVLRHRLLGPLVGLSTTSTPNGASSALAHLVRDFTAHSEGLAAQKQFGAAGLEIAERLFAAWHECRGDADRARLGERLGPLKQELRALLEEAARKAARNRRHRSFAGNLLKRWPALWSFASMPGVEPTNNHAERGLRGAVIYRKLSLGSQSARGERTIERLLSASVTCRLQRRSLSSPTSPMCSPPKRAATPSRCSPEHGDGGTERLPQTVTVQVPLAIG